MRDVTLCFLRREGEICLAMKKRGFGVGKWNGVGGKLQEGETLEQGAVREAKEEIGVDIDPADLAKVGEIEFYFNDKPADWNQRVHVYFAKTWQGEPSESEEMAPKWHKCNELPFDSMWADDPHWVPRVIAGEKIKGAFYFNNAGAEIDRFEIKTV